MFSVSPPSFWVRFGNRHSLPSLTHLRIVFQGNLLHGWSGESSYPASHFSTGRWICTTLPGTETFCNVKKMWQRRIFRSSWLLQVWYLRAYILHRFFLARFFHDELEIMCSKWFMSFVSLHKPHKDGVRNRCKISTETSLAWTRTRNQEELWWPDWRRPCRDIQTLLYRKRSKLTHRASVELVSTLRSLVLIAM